MTLDVALTLTRERFLVDVAFSANAGTTVAVLGPNGAGKTTVIGCLAGILSPDHGRITLDGRTLLDTENGIDVPAESRPIGVMFQDPLLFPHLSALENAAFPLRARGVVKAVARARARELLERFGFPASREDSIPSGLSGGEAQRVALARALIAEPRLLMLDEPTSALDRRSLVLLRPLIAQTLRSFDGVRLVVTHDPVEAMTLADHLIVLEDGAVTQAGSPEDLRRTPGSSYVAELVGLNVFRGTIEPHDDGVAKIVSAEGDVMVAVQTELPIGTPVIGVLRPTDIELHLDRPPEGSAWNVVEGRIGSISIDGERAQVRIDGRPPLVLDITLASRRRLQLEEGSRVWASFKALAVTVEPSGEAAGPS